MSGLPPTSLVYCYPPITRFYITAHEEYRIKIITDTDTMSWLFFVNDRFADIPPPEGTTLSESSGQFCRAYGRQGFPLHYTESYVLRVGGKVVMQIKPQRQQTILPGVLGLYDDNPLRKLNTFEKLEVGKSRSGRKE
jgi:hypothetical protein